jgi:hypothetical protein
MSDVKVPPAPITVPASEAALQQVRDELNAMPEDKILRGTRASADASAAIAEAAAAKIAPLRGEIVALFGEPAGALVDQLPVYARATTQAAIEARVMAPSGDLSARYEDLREHYALVITELDSLVNRKVLEPSQLVEAREIQGYDQLIKSTRSAVLVARQAWSNIVGKTQLTPAMLDAAAAAADRLYRAILDRDHGVSRSPALELRVRALSKLLTTYDEVRRILTYVRWHQRDYDTLAPSPYTVIGRRRSSTDETDEPTPSDPMSDDDQAPASPLPPMPTNGGGPFTT